MLIWVKNAPSPQVIRDRLMADDSVFRTRLIDYLESCHQGEFIHGSLDQVRASVGENYVAPTHLMPRAPPPLCETACNPKCDKCRRLDSWWVEYEHEIDDLLVRSNVHSCRRGVCKARFPRDVFTETMMDEDGHLNLRHREPQLNTISQIITYFSRCNTDCTSLLSGTAIKAVISYVSDYISKLGLKSYQAFAAVFDVFERNADDGQLDVNQDGDGQPNGFSVLARESRPLL
ncbi:hypothetical protein C8R46DRAFT_1162191 [Mycena filopes]|nr:hypothetical protein C8R46DRAFT_1162191 [Mycena filopes]